MIRKTSKHCKAHMCYLPVWGHGYYMKDVNSLRKLYYKLTYGEIGSE